MGVGAAMRRETQIKNLFTLATMFLLTFAAIVADSSSYSLFDAESSWCEVY